MGDKGSPGAPIRAFPAGGDPSVHRFHQARFRRGWIAAVLTGLILGVFSLGVWQLDLFREFELRTLDARFRWRGSVPSESPVAIVFIGDDSIAEFGRWPWSWDHHALLIDVLQRAGAKMIIFDVFFAESPGKDQVELLSTVTGKAGNVYLCSFSALLEQEGSPFLLQGGDVTEPVPELLAAAAGTGHCNARPDVDGITRRIPLLLSGRQGHYPAIILRAAADFIGASLEGLDLSEPGLLRLEGVKGRSLEIPADDRGETMANFLGGLEAFPRYSFLQVLQADSYPAKAAVDLTELRDRIVLVGVTFTGNTDMRPTPFSPVYPMIGIQATLLDNILTGRFVRHLPTAARVFLWLFLGALTGGLAFSLRPLASFPLTLLVSGAYLGAALGVFDVWRLRLDLTGPLATVLLAYLVVTTRQYIEVRRQKMRYLERMKYLGHLVESSTDAIVSFDRSGTVASWNHGAQEIFGYPERETLGREWSFLAAPEDRERFDGFLGMTLAGRAVESQEMRFVKADGRTIPVHASFSPIRDSRGGLVGISLISQDLTEKKKMIEVLVQSEKLAEIGRMGSGIVHEIKNPLTSIMMMSSMITADASLPAKAVRYADIIEKESQRILRLSRNILSFARPKKAEMKDVDVNRILEETLELAEYELKKAKVAVRRNFAGGLPPARGDGEKLKQVFLNIITNAGHAMEGGGELSVSTFSSHAGEGEHEGIRQGWNAAAAGEVQAEHLVVARIADSGPGMPAEVMGKVFEPFFSTKGEGKGTGLGLYISRNIILEHQGRISAVSREGEGTVFTVSLPVAGAGGGA